MTKFTRQMACEILQLVFTTRNRYAHQDVKQLIPSHDQHHAGSRRALDPQVLPRRVERQNEDDVMEDRWRNEDEGKVRRRGSEVADVQVGGLRREREEAGCEGVRNAFGSARQANAG